MERGGNLSTLLPDVAFDVEAEVAAEAAAEVEVEEEVEGGIANRAEGEVKKTVSDD